MVVHLTLSNKLDVIFANFTAVQARSVNDGSYWSEVELSSASRRIVSNCGT